MSCLQVEKVSCRYNGQNVLEQLSLTVADNEIVCLLGASGCGKTTLLKTVAGLLPLAEGSIRLGDTLLDGPGVTVSPERRHIGMIFQDYALFPHLTVAENIGFGLTRVPRDSRQQQIEEALTLVNLQGLGDRYPHQLSGGQQQRVAIARALVQQPRMLLLDEPSSMMDPATEARLIDNLRSIKGVTMLLVTHRMAMLPLVDRLVVLDQGRVVMDGPRNEVLRKLQGGPGASSVSAAPREAAA